MKLTKKQLKRIIKEELEAVISGEEDMLEGKELPISLEKLRRYTELAPEYKALMDSLPDDIYTGVRKALSIGSNAFYDVEGEAMMDVTEEDQVIKSLGIQVPDGEAYGGWIMKGVIVDFIQKQPMTDDNINVLKQRVFQIGTIAAQTAVSMKRSFMQKSGSFLKGKGYK